VRELVFIREPIHQKDIKTTGQSSSTKGTGSTLEGPAVNFGYAVGGDYSYVGRAAATDLAYHVDSPEIVLPGLKMLQSPIVSRSGTIERDGHRITGACTFYAPSLDYIKALDNFIDTVAFSELESYDKLIDIERVIVKIPDNFNTSGSTNTFIFAFDSNQPAYEMDRLQFKIKAGQSGQVLTNVNIWAKLTGDDVLDGSYTHNQTLVTVDKNGNNGNMSNAAANCVMLIDPPNTSIPTDKYITIDIPVRHRQGVTTTGDGSFASIYVDGVRTEVDADYLYNYDPEKIVGTSTQNLAWLDIVGPHDDTTLIKDIYLYKEAQWIIESIKDYRDEYMQITAARVRGERASRRRAYG
jgi:hypothetical protein